MSGLGFITEHADRGCTRLLDLTESFYKVVLQKSIPAQICQLIIYIGDHKEALGMGRVSILAPLPSERKSTSRVLSYFAWQPRPESGLDCLICTEFARQRTHPITGCR